MSKLLKWIVNIILLAAIIIAGGLLIPPLVGITTFIVDDVDMATNLAKGSVTYGTDKELSELAVGDEILVKDSDGEYVYRIKSIDASADSCQLEDVKSSDGKTKEEVFRKAVTKVVFTIPFIGYIVMAMKSTEGLIIIGLAVIFVIVLFILAELWKKDEEDDEEDDESSEHEMPSAPPARVDVPAQILEEVSSEIASAVSSVVAEESIKPNVEANGLGENTGTVDIKEIAKAVGEKAEEPEAEEEALVRELEEAQGIGRSVGDDVVEVETDNQDAVDVQEKEDEQGQAAVGVEEEVEAEEMSEASGKIELAMPAYSMEELLQKAREAGDDPEVKTDDEFGVTFLDYSDIL